MNAITETADQQSEPATGVLRLGDYGPDRIVALLSRYGLVLEPCDQDDTIPGSFWGDDEAGLVGNRLYARPDTPVHSILHEACHFICMDQARRSGLHTDAGGDELEECAVCYLQIVLAGQLPDIGAARMMADMDRWAYSFRLGSTRAWLEKDARDARAWLLAQGILCLDGEPSFRRRAG